MGRTHHLLDAVTAAPATPTVVYPQRASDETGIFQVSQPSATGTFTVNLQGRLSPDAPWYDIEEILYDSTDDHNDMASTPFTISAVVVIFPEMRGNVSAISGATVSAWLSE